MGSVMFEDTVVMLLELDVLAPKSTPIADQPLEGPVAFIRTVSPALKVRDPSSFFQVLFVAIE